MTLRPFIVPVFIPHQGCPHRCVFCNQHVVTSAAKGLPHEREIREAVRWFFSAADNSRRDTNGAQVAFYGGNFTALPQDQQSRLLTAVGPLIATGKIHSVRISTRPDAISPKGTETLKNGGVATVELGVQSMNDDVLRLSARGHTSEDTERALHILREAGFAIGVQLMLGLPGDTSESFRHTIDRVIELAPDFIRLYPTLVIKDTALERWFYEGRYHPLTLQEAVTLAKEALRRFRACEIPVIRIGLQPTPSLDAGGTIVTGPYHPAFRQLVESEIMFDHAAALLTTKGIVRDSSPLFLVAPSDTSTFIGQNRGTIRRLCADFGLSNITVKATPGIPRGTIELVC